jgi:hypothetical protein
MCNKSIICGVLFVSGAITFYEGNNMSSALLVNCKEDYDHLKLACKPFFQKINTLYEKASIEVEEKHFDLDILMGGDMKFL